MYQLPKEYRWATLDAPELASRVCSRNAVVRARASVGALRIVLVGKPGVGKTSLAIAIAREAMKRRDQNGMYVEAIELDLARSEGKLGKPPEDVQRAIEVPVLVLDELGGEAAVSKDVEQVIRRRYREGLETIIVSALPVEAVASDYSGGINRRLEESIWINVERERQPPPYNPAIRVLPARAPLAALPGPRGVPADLAGATPWARPAAAPQRATAGGPEGGAVPCPPELRERLLADLERIGQGPAERTG